MLFKLVCTICVAGVTAGLLNFNQGALPWLQPNTNINNNRIRDTFMSGVLRGKNTACNGTGALAMSRGECKPQKECRKQGGTPSGTCALVGSCCIIQNTCSNTTRAKISYFATPPIQQPSCGLTIVPFSPNVCQLRLDFEMFEIEGPAAPTINPPTLPPPFCNSDSFAVIGTSTNNIGFEALCGSNTGQHIYIPVNNSLVTLQFSIQTDRTNLQVSNPMWRIRVTQLECTSTIQDYSSLQSALTSIYQKHQTKNSRPDRDRDLIAPPGCLQYFTEPSGSYESFNYNNGQGPTIANLNYAICFKRDLLTCGLTHTVNQFALSGPIPEDCRSSNDDWLLIPGSTRTDGITDYFCGNLDQNEVITSRVTGPLYVGVRSDAVPSNAPDGFRMNYNALNSCPPTTFN